MAFADLDNAALAARYVETERELTLARFQHGLGQLENSARLRVLRHDIARLRTELRTREIAAGLAKDSLLRANRVKSTGPAPTKATAEKGGFLQGIVDKLTGKD
jgi:large subunit ribosomal protein L29